MSYTYNRANKPNYKEATFHKLAAGNSVVGKVNFAAKYIDDKSQWGPKDRMTIGFDDGTVFRSAAKSFIEGMERELEGRVDNYEFTPFDVAIIARPASFTDKATREVIEYTQYIVRVL